MKATLIVSAVAVLLLCLCSTNAQFHTYDQLYRTFLTFAKQPLTTSDAQNQGYTAFNGQNCVPGLGIAYSSKSGGPTELSPGFLYFNAAGQITGIGIRVYSDYVPQNLVPQYWVPVPGHSKQYDLSVIFRDPRTICSPSKGSSVLGDRVLLGGKISIPLNSTAARREGWTEGACIPRMGTHWSLDTTGNGAMTWNSSTLFPLMPMYGPEDGLIKAVLIPTPSFQYTFPLGEYEGPFTDYLMCLNWCQNTGCTFSGTSVWTTMHWLFTDYNDVTCTGAKCVV